MVYVERTSGFGSPERIVKIRDASHNMPGFGAAKVSTSAQALYPSYAARLGDPAYFAIRGSEQLQIEAWRKLGLSANRYNGISPTNGRIDLYIREALRRFPR